MWVELDNGELVNDPWFDWSWDYPHAASRGKPGTEIRKVKCSLYAKDEKLWLSVSYNAVAGLVAQDAGLTLGSYAGCVLKVHIYEVTGWGKLPSGALRTWTSKLKGQLVDVNDPAVLGVLTGATRGKVRGKVMVYG